MMNDMEFMSDKLIVTGWGWMQFVAAVALLLRHKDYTDADVVAESGLSLPQLLLEDTEHREIVVLGVDLSCCPAALAKALKVAVDERGVVVRWVSSAPLLDAVTDDIRTRMDMYVDLTCLDPTEAVAKRFDMVEEYRKLAPLAWPENLPANLVHHNQLLESAMYQYRNYQDHAAFVRAVHFVADDAPESEWTPADHKMVEHYQRYGNRELWGVSDEMEDLRSKIATIASHPDARVLIVGESGTGKETVALQIHNRSKRSSGPFIPFNCASVAQELLESRFLGHEKGAFTGAYEKKAGVFELAHGGTLFLDEIAELPLEAQGILLRVLEESRFRRVGEKEEIRVDVRVIAATHRNLLARVREGKFREDLFYRLNVIQLRVPALREIGDDLGRIANLYYMKRFNDCITPAQRRALFDYDYPGNIRELINLLERAHVFGEKDFAKLIREHKLMNGDADQKRMYSDSTNLEDMTKAHVRAVYEACGGNSTKAAEQLGITRKTVVKYLNN